MEASETKCQDRVQCESEGVHGGERGWALVCRVEAREGRRVVTGEKPTIPKTSLSLPSCHVGVCSGQTKNKSLLSDKD